MMMSPAYGKVLPLQTLHIPNFADEGHFHCFFVVWINKFTAYFKHFHCQMQSKVAECSQ